MPKDRKLKAELTKTHELKKEINLRVQENEQLLATEDKGFLQTETERERTLKVSQDELKSILPEKATHNVSLLFING